MGRDGAKNLDSSKKAFSASQPIEITQNRQRNLWKSLEKQAENLEMFGASLEKLAPASRYLSGNSSPIAR
jgi:hypothetical protein